MAEKSSVVALLLAAGSGVRLKSPVPKAFVQLRGATLLQRSAKTLAESPSIDQIVVALPPDLTADHPLRASLPSGVTAVAGGPTRSQSVASALAAAAHSEVVLVHDAARPLLSVALVEAVLQALRLGDVDGAIAAVPLTDTLKLAAAAQDGGPPPPQSLPLVAATIPREGLFAVQTPQAFLRRALARALAQPPEVLAQATDDASLIEGIGGRVVLVPSFAGNIKITTEEDLKLASALLCALQRD